MEGHVSIDASLTDVFVEITAHARYIIETEKHLEPVIFLFGMKENPEEGLDFKMLPLPEGGMTQANLRVVSIVARLLMESVAIILVSDSLSLRKDTPVTEMLRIASGQVPLAGSPFATDAVMTLLVAPDGLRLFSVNPYSIDRRTKEVSWVKDEVEFYDANNPEHTEAMATAGGGLLPVVLDFFS